MFKAKRKIKDFIMLIIYSVVRYIMTIMQRKGKRINVRQHHTRRSGIQVKSGGKYNKRIIQADIVNTQSTCKLFFLKIHGMSCAVL